jgi:G-patch domain
MALYGHYEKSEKAVVTRAVMRPDVLARSRLGESTQPGAGVGAGSASQSFLLQLREQQTKEQEEQAMAMHVGASLLCKMGWEGLALGRSGAPAAKPLTAVKRGNREGLGCDTGFAAGAPTASASAHYSSVSSSTNNSKKAVMRDKMIARFQNAS